MILSDRCIKELNAEVGGVIYPFVDHQVTTITSEFGAMSIPSYGLSAAGYDLRLGDEFSEPEGDGWSRPYKAGGGIALGPNSCILAHTLETIQIPRDFCGKLENKSTWVRQLLLVLATPIEPGWRGQITLEMKNLSPHPIFLMPGVGIAQLQFHLMTKAPEMAYCDRNGGKGGKYQGQTGVTLARF